MVSLVRHGRPVVVRMELPFCRYMRKGDGIAVFHVLWFTVRDVVGVAGPTDSEPAVFVAIGIKRDLLLLGPARVSLDMGMQISSGGSDVADKDFAAVHDLAHGFRDDCVSTKGCCEFRGDKARCGSGVLEDEEVETEHGDVESDWEKNEAERAGGKVSCEYVLWANRDRESNPPGSEPTDPPN